MGVGKGQANGSYKNHGGKTGLKKYIDRYISTWSYENQVSKHSVIFLNFHCLIACLLCCLLMSCFFLGGGLSCG